MNTAIEAAIRRSMANGAQRESVATASLGSKALEARFQALVTQRDNAMNEVVVLYGRVAELEEQLRDALKLASEVPQLKAQISKQSEKSE